MTDEIFTIYEAAEYLKVSDKTVRRLISNHLLIASRVGNSWRIKQSEIDNYLNKNNNSKEGNFNAQFNK